MEKETDTLTAFLTKDTRKNKVTVSLNETENAKKIVTKYTVLDYKNGNSLLEIDLKTGRTHQIRAHLAYIGHPLLNDGKYGTEEGRYRQALYSYKLVFNMKDAGILSYLDGRKFEIENCEIIQYFKENRYI